MKDLSRVLHAQFWDLGELSICCKITLKSPSQCEPVQAIHAQLQQALAGGEASALGYSQASEQNGNSRTGQPVPCTGCSGIFWSEGTICLLRTVDRYVQNLPTQYLCVQAVRAQLQQAVAGGDASASGYSQAAEENSIFENGAVNALYRYVAHFVKALRAL